MVLEDKRDATLYGLIIHDHAEAWSLIPKRFI